MKRTRISIGISILIAAAMTAGCTKDIEETASAGAPVAQQPRAAQPSTLTIPSGTTVLASLDTPLSTDLNHSGDAFTATTIEPIVVGGKTVVPSGAGIRGVLQNVEDSGRIQGRAQMTLSYQSIVDSKGESYAISATPLTLQAASNTHGDIEKIAAGTVLGAIVGGIADGGKGAAIGAGAGAGAGTVVMLATKGADLELSPGQRLAVHMTGATSVQVASR